LEFKSANRKIFRYFTYEKFENWISSGTLAATRLDLFEDKSELGLDFLGLKSFIESTSKKNHIGPNSQLKKVEQLPDAFRVQYVFGDTKYRLYASCWTFCENDNYFWNNYAQNSDSLMVESEINKIEDLEFELPGSIDIRGRSKTIKSRPVQYLDGHQPKNRVHDHQSEVSSWEEMSLWYRDSPFFKRSEFSQEQEFRVVALVGETSEEFGHFNPRFPGINFGPYGTPLPIGWPKRLLLPTADWARRDRFVSLSANPEAKINRIVLSPKAGRADSNKITTLLSRCNIQIPVLANH